MEFNPESSMQRTRPPSCVPLEGKLLDQIIQLTGVMDAINQGLATHVNHVPDSQRERIKERVLARWGKSYGQ